MLEEGYTLKERGSGERDEQKRSGTQDTKEDTKTKRFRKLSFSHFAIRIQDELRA